MVSSGFKVFIELPQYGNERIGLHMIYKTKGTCSTSIDVELKDGVIDSVKFTGGCNGNLQGISALVKGMTPEEAISRLKGIRCGFKPTSCPDQLAHALEEMIAQ